MTTYQDIQNLSNDEYTALWNKPPEARDSQLNSEYGLRACGATAMDHHLVSFRIPNDLWSFRDKSGVF